MEGRPRYAEKAVDKVDGDGTAEREISAGYLLAMQQN